MKWLDYKLDEYKHSRNLKRISTKIVDERLASEVQGYETDNEAVSRHRKDAEKTIRDIKHMLETSSQKKRFSLYKIKLKAIKKYSTSATKQVDDIKKIIVLLSKLNRQEYLDIFYDLRIPLSLFELQLNRIEDELNNIDFSEHEKRDVTIALKWVNHIFDRLTNSVIDMINKDKSFFDSLRRSEERAVISEHISQRTKIKAQIAQTVRIFMEGMELISIQVQNHGKITDQEFIHLMTNLKEFYMNFKYLAEICEKRIRISNDLILESLLLQREHALELDKIEKEADEVISNFNQQSETEKWRTDGMKKFQEKMVEIFKDLKESMLDSVPEIKGSVKKSFSIQPGEREKIRKSIGITRRNFLAVSSALLVSLSVASVIDKASDGEPVKTPQTKEELLHNIIKKGMVKYQSQIAIIARVGYFEGAADPRAKSLNDIRIGFRGIFFNILNRWEYDTNRERGGKPRQFSRKGDNLFDIATHYLRNKRGGKTYQYTAIPKNKWYFRDIKKAKKMISGRPLTAIIGKMNQEKANIAYDEALKVFNKLVPDPTKGSLFYQNPDATKHPNTIEDWVKLGRIPIVKINSHVHCRYNPDHLIMSKK